MQPTKVHDMATLQVKCGKQAQILSVRGALQTANIGAALSVLLQCTNAETYAVHSLTWGGYALQKRLCISEISQVQLKAAVAVAAAHAAAQLPSKAHLINTVCNADRLDAHGALELAMQISLCWICCQESGMSLALLH